jgi:aspartate-semialdehyde dehydrogenase
MGYRVVVVGATGNVGREMLNILAEREFPIDEIAVLASSRSQGSEIDFGETGKKLKVQNVEHFDFTGWDIALFAAGSAPTKIYAPKAASQGCVVIDNSSLYRMDPDVPLIVPEVNPDAIDGYTARNIIANPNCSTAQMVVALKPLHDKAKIKRVVVATYQSVSGAGKEGMDELFEQSRAIFVGDQVEPKKFTKQIAFNVIPHIDTSSTMARPRKSGRWWPKPRRSSIPRSRSRPRACACRCSSAIPKRSTWNSRTKSRPPRPRTCCAKRRA